MSWVNQALFWVCCGAMASGQTAANLTVKSATAKEVDLTWTGAAASYQVQRAPTGGSFTTIATVTTTSAADTQFDPYLSYQYEVIAISGSSASAPSAIVTVGPPPAGFTVASLAPVPPGTDRSENYGHDLTVTLDGNGDPAFAYIYTDPNGDSDASDSQLLFRSWNRARNGWNPVVTIPTKGAAYNDDYPTASLAFDASTQSWVLAAEFDEEATLRIFTSSDGVTWAQKTSYSNKAGNSQGPSLALASGTIYLAFIDPTGLRYITGQLSASPSTWVAKTPPRISGTAATIFQTAPSLALDANGVPGIAYWADSSARPGAGVLLFWRPASAGNPVKAGDTSNYDNNSYGIAKLVFFNLNPRIATYYLLSDDDITGVHFTRSDDGGDTWAASTLIAPDRDNSTNYPLDLAIGPQDQGAIPFSQSYGTGENDNGNPKLARSADLNTWTTGAAAPQNVTGGYDASPISLDAVFGGNGKLLMLWTEVDQNPTGDGILMWREPPDNVPSGPVISANGVVDAASFRPAIVSGSWVTIFGANFSTTTRIWSDSDFSGNLLPTALSGVSVKMNGQPAPVYYIGPGQLDVQAPSGLSGNVSVVVTSDGQSSNPATVAAAQSSPSLFVYSAGAKTYAAAVEASGASTGATIGDPTLTPETIAAKPGDIISLFATGLEPEAAGLLVHTPIITQQPVNAMIGSQTAAVQFAGLVAAGEFQINVTVPAVAAGDQPVSIVINGVTSQTGVLLHIGQ